MVTVHSPEMGVSLPVHPDGIYAVVRIKGIQHKVVKDDRIRTEVLGDVEVG